MKFPPFFRDIASGFGQLAKDVGNVIFPNVCTVCDRTLVRGEEILCLDCLLALPRTNLHKTQPNMIHERVMAIGHPVERATSIYYYYRENKYARLVHDTKYRGRPIVGETLTKSYAEELQKIDFFNGIDAIVPVPLHFLKKFHRGYNQAERLALAISEVTGIEVINALKAKSHKSQTRKGAHARLVNTLNVYSVDPHSELDGKHILLVDDVITTGSTLLSCIKAIHSASPTSRISIYSLAITQQS